MIHHIHTTVTNNTEYTFTCTVCKYTENRLLLTAKGAIKVSNNFKKQHEKCGKKLESNVQVLCNKCNLLKRDKF